MTEIMFRTGWNKHDPQLIRDARSFWTGLGVLDSEEILEREQQLCALAYADGQVVGASTAVAMNFPKLRSRFAYYRTMVSPNFRRQHLASRLCEYSRDQLARWARENPEEKIMGLLIVLQAEEFRHRQHVPIGTQDSLKLVLVGYTPNGFQFRVVWFDHATVE